MNEKLDPTTALRRKSGEQGERTIMNVKPPILATDAGFEEAVRNTINNRIAVLSSDDGSGMYAELEAFVNRTDRIVRDYNGRQVFEMLQNMDDQMRDDVPDNDRCSEVLLDKKGGTLSFRNNGHPFSFGGIVSILRPDISPKEKQPTIGNKGLGFRSLLNWKPRELVIRAGNIELVFSAKAVDRNVSAHDNLRRAVEALRDKEKELPILSFPDIGKREGAPEWTTEIELRGLDENAIESIEKELRDFRSETLLFLPNLREIKILIKNGETCQTVYSDTSWETIDEENSIFKRIICTKAGDKPKESTDWLAFRKDDTLDVAWGAEDSISNYNVAIAVPLGGNGWNGSRKLRNYLPVRDVVIELPCLVHATVALNDTRDGLPPDNPVDKKIFENILPTAIKTFAEFLRDNAKEEYVKDRWFPWRLLSPSEKSPNPYVRLLYDKLHSFCESGAFVPCVDEEFRAPNDSRYFAKTDVPDGIAAFFNKHKNLLPNHVLSTEQSPVPESFGAPPCKPGELEKAINGAVASAKLSDEELAELIHVLWRIRQREGGTGTFNVLRDSNNRFPVAGERMYTPVGESKMKIPDFMSLGFLSDSLWTAVQNRFSSELDQWRRQDSRNWLRSFCRNDLSSVIGIVWYDKTAVTRQMVSACRERLRLATSQSEKRTLVSQLLDALYQNFDPGDVWNPENELDADAVSDSGESSSRRMEYPIDVDVNGVVKNAVEFLFESAKEFYHGALSEDIFLTEEKARNLLGVSDGDDARIKAFFRTLGVRDDVRVEYLDLAKPRDDGYLDFLKDSGCLPPPSGTPLPPRQLFPRLRDAEIIRNLSIEHLLGLLTIPGRNGFADLLIEKPVVQWKEEKKWYSRPFTVDWSYCAFQLKDSNKGFVIEENRKTIENLERRLQGTPRSPESIVDILITKMGARRTLEDLSLEELYGRLETFEDRSGVQGFYQRVRMIINNRIDACETDERKSQIRAECERLAKLYLSHLFARKGKGPLEKVQRGQIRYWDNDTLSRSLLDRFYKLEIGHRVGALSIRQIFGVETLGKAAVSVTKFDEAPHLTEALETHLRLRQVYVLALRYRELSDPQKRKATADALRNLFGTIKVVRSCEYKCEDECFAMSEGDLLQTDNGYILCTGAPDLIEAMKRPGFCMAVSEMLCILFELTGPRAAGEIRNAVKNTLEEIEIYRTTDISDDVWRNATEALGLGEEEKRIWSVRLGRALSQDEESELAVRGSRAEAIRRLMEGEVPDGVPTDIPLGDMNNDQTEAFVRWLKAPTSALGERTADKLRELRRTRFKNFQHDSAIAGFVATEIHRRLETESAEERQKYVPLVLRLKFDSNWFCNRLNNLLVENPLADDSVLWGVLKDSVLHEFAVQLPETVEACEGSSEPKVGTPYQVILDEAGMELSGVDAPKRSLAFFPGHEEDFRKIVENTRRMEEESTAPELDGNVPEEQNISIQRVSSVGDLPSSVFWPYRESSAPSRHSMKATHYQSDKRKRQIGKRAEEMVWNAIKSDSGTYRNPQAWSSLLDKTGTANDSLHYDISYQTPKKEDRYVEVKAFDGHAFFMSEGEYKFATDEANCKKYVLALVAGYTIHFIEAPFAPDSPFNDVLCVEPSDYTGHFESRAAPPPSSPSP